MTTISTTPCNICAISNASRTVRAFRAMVGSYPTAAQMSGQPSCGATIQADDFFFAQRIVMTVVLPHCGGPYSSKNNDVLRLGLQGPNAVQDPDDPCIADVHIVG